MRRLLMISPHFPPDSSAGTHRVRLLAPHLAARGWDPIVLTVAPGGYEGRLDPALAALVPADLRVERVRALPAGLTRALGLGDLGLRALPGLRRAALRLGGAGIDAVFITIYPAYPALLGPLLKRRFGVPFVLDYQDPWVGAWGLTVGGGAGGAVDFRSRASRALAARLEPGVLRAADAVTAVSARTYEDALARTGATPRERLELPIGWEPRDLDALRAHRPVVRLPADGDVHLCYVGTLLPAGIGTLRALLDGLRQAVDRAPEAARLRLHFFGTSNQTTGGEARVLPHARELGVADRVHEHPARLDYLDALGVLAQSAGVLLLGSAEPHYTPSKVFPALMAGRQVLALYHAASPVCALLSRALPPPAGRLITYDEARPAAAAAAAVADALIAMAGREPGVVPDLGAIEPWSAPALAARLAALCDRLVA